jgi:hypothetical protein
MHMPRRSRKVALSNVHRNDRGARVRIIADPMPALRAAAVAKVNERFNYLASQNTHRDAAHAHKRTVAAAVISGAQVPVEFAAEAEMRGITPLALARDVASRPNEAAHRELDRQRELLAIAATQTPDELPR